MNYYHSNVSKGLELFYEVFKFYSLQKRMKTETDVSVGCQDGFELNNIDLS